MPRPADEPPSTLPSLIPKAEPSPSPGWFNRPGDLWTKAPKPGQKRFPDWLQHRGNENR